MSSNTVVKLLTEMFGAGSLQLKQATTLVATGAELQCGLFKFTAKVDDKLFEYVSPVMFGKYLSSDSNVQSIMRDKVTAVLNNAFLSGIKQTDDDEAKPVEEKPAAPEPTAMASTSPATAKLKAQLQQLIEENNKKPDMSFHKDAVVTPSVQLTELEPAKTAPVIVPTVIKLSAARAIKQPVKGSSSGSVYKAVAIGEVNVAIRLNNASLSVRAEFQNDRNSKIVSNLVGMGFTDHTSYLSMHLSLSDGAPASRVIGSVLMGMNVDFEQVITNGASLT